jgi:hypothetical protein
LAAYVQGHHQDSVTILLSSGFQASRRPSPVALPVVPANARLTAGSVSGSVVLRTQKSANADNSSPRFFAFSGGAKPPGPALYKLTNND